jgi:hypothetical protein
MRLHIEFYIFTNSTPLFYALVRIFTNQANVKKSFVGLRNTNGAQISIFPKAKNDAR